MKYYYISQEGPFRGNLIIGKDDDRIFRDKNKIIITRINGSFHILVCRNGNFLKEKFVLSYFELVNFLKRNSFNAYFINVSRETASYINSYVKKDDEFIDRDSVIRPKPFFTIDEGKLIKAEAYIKRDIMREKLEEVYDSELEKDYDMQTLSLEEFLDNKELFSLYSLPIHEKGGKFLIPNYCYDKPSLFYILSGIYNKDGDNINLNSDDLLNIYIATILDDNGMDEIKNSIKINILESYEIDRFNKSLDFIDLYKRQEKEIFVKLKSMKECLIEGKKNQKIVQGLGIMNSHEKYSLKKKVVE